MDYASDTVLVTGVATLPRRYYLAGTGPNLVIALVIDPSTGLILEADCNIPVELSRRFIADLLVGHSMKEPITALVVPIGARALTATSAVVESAGRDAFRNYGRRRARVGSLETPKLCEPGNLRKDTSC